jgi:hypothetical protein
MGAPAAASFAFLTRRRVLALGAGAVGVLLVGGLGLDRLRGMAPAVAGLRVLDVHEYRTLDLVATAILPSGGPFALGAENADLARAFDGYLADEPPENVEKLRRAILLLEYGPVLFEHRLVTFSNLSPEERLAHYRSWAESEVPVRRQVAVAFRKFMTLVFYDRPEVWPFIHYPGPSLARQKR